MAYTEEQVLAVRRAADDVGMEISFLHSPWFERANGKTLYMNELWYENGHEHCYMETIPYLDLFGKDLFCVHLHDNYGRDKNDIRKDADYRFCPLTAILTSPI